MPELIHRKPTATTTQWCIWGPGIWRVINKQDAANTAALALGRGNSRLVTQAQWDLLEALSASAGPEQPSWLTPDDLVQIASLVAAKVVIPAPLTHGTITLAQ